MSGHEIVVWRPQVNGVYQYDALSFLRQMETGSVNCIVTSPPYFGLRNYNVDGQIGLEETPAQFVAALVAVFREARRVLRDDGTIWVNMGDSYGTGGSGQNFDPASGATNQGGQGKAGTFGHRKTLPIQGMHKNLLGIPWRLAFALQDDGWILRSDIIWSKPNPMPESVTDRPTKAHEYVFMFAKQPRYWYDADAIREKQDSLDPSHPSYRKGLANGDAYSQTGKRFDMKQDEYRVHPSYPEKTLNPAGRNKRSVWTIATEPTPLAHFATFPQKLIEPMILAGCPGKVCAVCGAPWVRVVEVSGGTIGNSWVDHSEDQERGVTRHGSTKAMKDGTYRRETKGFEPTCNHNAATRPGLVLDPFFGSGTTGLVARRLGRNWIGCDLSATYCNIARERLRRPDDPHYVTKPSAPLSELPMFADLPAESA